jgi:hypothetical protein
MQPANDFLKPPFENRNHSLCKSIMSFRRSKSRERQFQRRGLGVMRKADDVNELFPEVKSGSVFRDGNDLLIYESEPGFLSSISSVLLMENIVLASSIIPLLWLTEFRTSKKARPQHISEPWTIRTKL